MFVVFALSDRPYELQYLDLPGVIAFPIKDQFWRIWELLDEQAICLFTQSSSPVQTTVTMLVAGVDTRAVANQPQNLQTWGSLW